LEFPRIAQLEDEQSAVRLDDDLPFASFAHGPPDTATVRPVAIRFGVVLESFRLSLPYQHVRGRHLLPSGWFG
jgi:hypothetical protein